MNVLPKGSIKASGLDTESRSSLRGQGKPTNQRKSKKIMGIILEGTPWNNGISEKREDVTALRPLKRQAGGSGP